jgi:hypothetical protein
VFEITIFKPQVAHIVVKRNYYRVLVGKSRGKRPLGRLRHKWKDIKMDLKKEDGRVWTKFIWLRIGTSGRLL